MDVILARIEKSIEIRAPPEKVWGLLSWDRHPEWLDIIKSARWTSEKHAGVGATAHVIGEVAGRKFEWNLKFTEYVEKEKGTWHTTAGDLKAIGSTTLEPTKIGTKLTFVINYDLPYSILGKIIDKLMISKETERSVERGLEKLKNILEK